MLEGGIPQAILRADLRHLIGTLYWIKAAILGGFVAWMSVTRRPFCRWVCPLGALWAPFNTVSALRLQVDEEACIQCNRCQEVCPVDIRVYENANDSACIRCLACVRECPQTCINVKTLSWSLESDR
jgi:polyferredoxin